MPNEEQRFRCFEGCGYSEKRALWTGSNREFVATSTADGRPTITGGCGLFHGVRSWVGGTQKNPIPGDFWQNMRGEHWKTVRNGTKPDRPRTTSSIRTTY